MPLRLESVSGHHIFIHSFVSSYLTTFPSEVFLPPPPSLLRWITYFLRFDAFFVILPGCWFVRCDTLPFGFSLFLAGLHLWQKKQESNHKRSKVANKDIGKERNEESELWAARLTRSKWQHQFHYLTFQLEGVPLAVTRQKSESIVSN